VTRWITNLDAAPAWPEPCAWIVRRDAPEARSAATPTPDDLADAAAARSADGGAGRLWRRRLLRALAARWLGVTPEAIAFRRETPGAARLISPRPGVVSAASRGDWSIAAVGPDLLGVDLELAAGEPRGPLTPPEADLRRWTATEAYAKATGCSLEEAWASAASPERIAATGWPELCVSHVETTEFVAAAAWRP
jgi:phosphopantetheinyl transferase